MTKKVGIEGKQDIVAEMNDNELMFVLLKQQTFPVENISEDLQTDRDTSPLSAKNDG